MNDLTPIEMDELKRLEEIENPQHGGRRRIGWIVLVIAAVALAWYLLRGGSAPAAAPPMPVVTVATPLQQEITEWDEFIGHATADWDGTGTNRIDREYAGCVLHERYVTPGGYSGESLNTYDAARQVWHQTWVDNTGLLLQLDGRLVDGRMVLEGETPARDGPGTRHRITWTPNPDGSVRQLWESTDVKGGWTVAFDGRYKRKSQP